MKHNGRGLKYSVKVCKSLKLSSQKKYLKMPKNMSKMPISNLNKRTFFQILPHI